MRNYKTEAIILKRRNFGEADRMLTVFTKTSGKISIKAAGVRKIHSKRSSHIEPFTHSLLTLYKGNGIPVLTEATTLSNHSNLRENLTTVGFAYHLCELVDGLCAENQQNTAVFYLLQKTLERLAVESEIALVVHEFEVELLSLLGFWSQEKQFATLNMDAFIENILERRLRSKKFLTKLA